MLSELLLGKISNGCHVTWSENDPDPDPDDHDEDEDEDENDTDDIRDSDGAPDGVADDDDDTDSRPDPLNIHPCAPQPDREDSAAHHVTDHTSGVTDHPSRVADNEPDRTSATGTGDRGRRENSSGEMDPADTEPARTGPDTDTANDDPPKDAGDDWDLPASAFRPDPRPSDPPRERRSDPPDHARPGRPVITPCPNDHQPRPIPASIGVIISVQSLLGYTNTPGQLTDRSTLVPADLIRDLAQQPGTLFHRLLTDPQGNLLDVTEIGRFPSRKLGIAVKYRDSVCTNPICTVPAHRCDLDHIIPVPDGPTTAGNLNDDCRPEHRAKTHAGHSTSRQGNTSSWTTPTGHTYTATDQPFPVESWPIESEPPVST